MVAYTSLPICPDVLLDGVTYQVPHGYPRNIPVVAAASYASKLIKRSGGFTTKIHDRQMIGQVALFDMPDKATAAK
ncbi:Hydroxymethylglutaryl-CoA reductase (NADPH) [Streptococcus thermophilus CNCM I-1630]|nr:Hydroxymethylglutaryl-CoA reductase (NADPH) [Streptococcus thermophilus CNCM I-1630]